MFGVARCYGSVMQRAELGLLQDIKMHYYRSHRTINPTGIIPLGPRIDYTAPTRRAVPKLGG